MDLNTLGLKIARSENLPVLNNVVTQVLKSADDPNASARTLERIIERDPALTAKILRVSNSSYYGQTNVSSIARAISILGMNTIRSLVVGVAYQQILATRSNCQSFDRLAFWRHSLATAVGARIVMKLKQPMKSEELYVAGMMSGIGVLVLDKFLPSELDQALRIAQSSGIPLHAAEHEVLGYDHAEIGALLAEKSRLSEVIVSSIRFAHRPFEERKNFLAAGTVAAALALADRLGYTADGRPAPATFDAELFGALEIAEEQLPPIESVIQAEVERSSEAFGVKAAA